MWNPGAKRLNKKWMWQGLFWAILKPNNFSGMDMSREWKRGDCQKKLWNGVHQEEENEVDLNLPGRKGLEDW